MKNTPNCSSEAAQLRAEEALRFYNSSPRKAWSSQRIQNSKDDIRDYLPKGVEHLVSHGREIINDLLIDE